MSTTEQPVKPKASETTRKYVVLAPSGGEEGANWEIVGRPTAATDADARKQVGQTLPEGQKDDPLVAIPERYWKPKKRKVTTKISESWD